MFLSPEAVQEVLASTCEVGCQWERPVDDRREVGCQSEAAGRSDVAVQVDLLGLSCRKTESCDVPWRCVSVRADEPGGGALWQHCSSQQNSSVLCSPLTLSSVLLCSSPTQTQDSTPLFQLNQAEPSLPSTTQGDLSLPSMPFCGESPTASQRQSLDSLEPMGFIAPLSSDEEELGKQQDEHFPEVSRPPKRRRRRRAPLYGLKRRGFVKNLNNRVVQSSSDAETLTKKRRRRRTVQINPTMGKEDTRPRRKTVGLPLRYQMDYDMNPDQSVERVKRKIYMVGRDVTMGENGKETDKSQTEKIVFLHQSVLPDSSKGSSENPSKEPSIAKGLDTNGLEEKKQPNQPFEFEKFNIHYIKPRLLPLDTGPIGQKNKKPLSKQNVKLNVDKKPRLLALNETSDSLKEAIKQKLKNLQRTDGVGNQRVKSEEQIGGIPHKMEAKEALDWLIYDKKPIKEDVREESNQNPNLTASNKASDPTNMQNKRLKQEEMEEMQSLLALNANYKLLKAKQTNNEKKLSDLKPCMLASELASNKTSFRSKTVNQMLKARQKEDRMFGMCRKQKNPRGAVLNIVKVEFDEENGELTQVTGENGELMKQRDNGVKQRRPGRQRKNSQNKPDEFKRRLKPFCTEQMERPRRTRVGPPIRYLLESEELLDKSNQQLSPDRETTVKTGRRGRPKKIQIINTDVGGASEMIDGFKEKDDSKWPTREEETVVSLENEELKDANSLDLNKERDNQDEEFQFKIENVGGACKMFSEDREWTKREAPKLKRLTAEKRERKIKEESRERNEAENGQHKLLVVEKTAEGEINEERGGCNLGNKDVRNDSKDSDCEITYEHEDIERFVSQEEEGTESDVGGAREMVALLEDVDDRNAEDKTHLRIVKVEDLSAEGEVVGGACYTNDQTVSGEPQLTAKMKRRRRKRPRSDGDDEELKTEAVDVCFMHQDLDSGKTTLIPPCVVRLQQLT